MIRSMTGFGAAEGARAGLSARIEVRSVNHRHLQVKVRLPGDMPQEESELEALVKRNLGRGSVSVSVILEREQRAGDVHLDVELARRYTRLLGQLGKQAGIDGELSLEALARFPGVLTEERPNHPKGAGKLLRETMTAALGALVAMREKEGEHLARDLDKNLKAVEHITARIAKRMPKVVKEHFAATRRRAEELIGGQGSLDRSELARELALLADRLDVSEEVSRLASHVEQMRLLLDGDAPGGRRLEFLIQELLREVNTIGSKCNDAQVAHQVVELKTHIERLREQVLNVE